MKGKGRIKVLGLEVGVLLVLDDGAGESIFGSEVHFMRMVKSEEFLILVSFIFGENMTNLCLLGRNLDNFWCGGTFSAPERVTLVVF